MPPATIAHLESLLRTKRLDRTLTSSFAAASTPIDAAALGVGPFDDHLRGGFPRGEISEVVGGPTSGRTTLVLRALAAATRRGEPVALVDALDRLDVSSAAAAGLDLERALWIRGRVTCHRGPEPQTASRELASILKALSLVLQAGLCELVVLDVADASPRVIRALPMATWLRLHRMIEGHRTACVLVSSAPLWKSARGLSVEMSADVRGGDSTMSQPTHARLFEGLILRARVRRARMPSDASLCVPVLATGI